MYDLGMTSMTYSVGQRPYESVLIVRSSAVKYAQRLHGPRLISHDVGRITMANQLKA